MKNILLKNIILGGLPKDIRVSDGRIGSIRPAGELSPETGEEVLDCTGKVAMPGLINMHTHAGMSLMRGMQEDVVFHDWINNIWKIEAKIDAEYVYWATKVSVLEMIRTGTTTYNDHYWFASHAHKAAAELGLRPVVSYVVMDHDSEDMALRQKEECQRLYEESLGWKDGSKFEMGFHAIYSVSEPMILWAAEFAREHGLTLHFHLSETEQEIIDCKAAHGGLSPVEYLDRLGVLGDYCIAAHTLWLSDNDIRILGERKVNCVHNINSNLKLASGYKFMYNELRDAGANVCMGTDGCASSNNLDVLEAMKTSAMVQKAWRKDPKAWPLNELIETATVNGAKALRLDTGVIEEGKLADILVIDPGNSFFLSPGTFLANFVYSAHSDCIDSVIAGGRLVMKNKVIEGEKEILENARKVLSELI